mmetsp:Transcript_3566/g.10484  ORF Transcript_3566/g.10484 Transcript_3566/m.10484 type:complete len:453 (+) Transcript_3566:52-1410(+)
MSPLGSAFGEPLLPRAPPPGDCSRRLRQAAILAFGTLSTVQLGLGVGSLNNLCSDASSSLPWCPVLVAAFGLGGLLGSVLSARCDRLARKAVLLLSRLLLLASSLLLAGGFFTSGLPSGLLLLTGRGLLGAASGIATAVTPLHLAEVSPAEIRSVASAAQSAGVAIGILLAQLATLGGREGGVYLLPALCAALELTVLPLLPESPTHVLRRSGSAAALSHLMTHLHLSRAGAAAHTEALRSELAEQSGEGPFSPRELLSARSLRRELLLAAAVALSAQLCGCDCLFYYSTLVFTRSGLSHPRAATACLGVVNLAAAPLAGPLRSRVPRRTLLLLTWAGMSASYAAAAVAAMAGGKSLLAAPLACALVCYALGPGSLGGFLAASLFPMYAKDAAMTLAVALNWAATSATALAFPALHGLLGAHTFLALAALSALSGAAGDRFVTGSAKSGGET